MRLLHGPRHIAVTNRGTKWSTNKPVYNVSDSFLPADNNDDQNVFCIRYFNTSTRYFNISIRCLNICIRYFNTSIRYLNISIRCFNIGIRYFDISIRFIGIRYPNIMWHATLLMDTGAACGHRCSIYNHNSTLPRRSRIAQQQQSVLYCLPLPLALQSRQQ